MTNMLIWIILAWLSLTPPQPQQFTLTVTVTDIETQEGILRVGLFDQGERFMERNQAFRSVEVPVNNSSETVTFENLPQGNYAISLYHDANNNGTCDRNMFGIPKEPYAFSNNFRPRFSAPDFEDCQFEFRKDTLLSIRLLN